MNYVSGGVSGSPGKALVVKIPGASAKTAAKPDAKSPVGKLANFRWGKEAFNSGDELEMIADAKELDGRTVHFTVEHVGDKGTWRKLAETRATVSGGAVTGRVRVEHPAENVADPQHRSLRFKAELV